MTRAGASFKFFVDGTYYKVTYNVRALKGRVTSSRDKRPMPFRFGDETVPGWTHAKVKVDDYIAARGLREAV